MNTILSEEAHHIFVHNLTVEVIRKSIKNLHLGVYPPEGRIRVAAPLAVSDDAVRRAVIGKLGWIKRQQANFRAQRRQGKREMIDGESHYFQGQRYRLRVVENTARPKVILNKSRLELHVRPGTSVEEREHLLERWYRARLKELVTPLLEKWHPVVGVEPSAWGIRKMKTRWGSCNTETSRIWLNLELAKKPVSCVEYILVHELVHLCERYHNNHFRALMSAAMPHWQTQREEFMHRSAARRGTIDGQDEEVGGCASLPTFVNDPQVGAVAMRVKRVRHEACRTRCLSEVYPNEWHSSMGGLCLIGVLLVGIETTRRVRET